MNAVVVQANGPPGAGASADLHYERLGALIRPGTPLHHHPGKPDPLEEPVTAIS